MKNARGAYYDESRIEQFLIRNQDLSPVLLNARLLDDLDSFRGENGYPDDIAVVTCRFFVS